MIIIDDTNTIKFKGTLSLLVWMFQKAWFNASDKWQVNIDRERKWTKELPSTGRRYAKHDGRRASSQDSTDIMRYGGTTEIRTRISKKARPWNIQDISHSRRFALEFYSVVGIVKSLFRSYLKGWLLDMILWCQLCGSASNLHCHGQGQDWIMPTSKGAWTRQPPA